MRIFILFLILISSSSIFLTALFKNQLFASFQHFLWSIQVNITFISRVEIYTGFCVWSCCDSVCIFSYANFPWSFRRKSSLKEKSKHFSFLFVVWNRLCRYIDLFYLVGFLSYIAAFCFSIFSFYFFFALPFSFFSLFVPVQVLQ